MSSQLPPRTFRLSPGVSDEHYTPPEVFAALGCTFDLDPCQPDDGRAFLSVPCARFITASQDGLRADWHGFVWLNPPFGGRNGVVPWLKKFVQHGNGIVLVNALTSCGWFHDFAPLMDNLLFPAGKTKFVKPDGTRGKSPQNGIVLMSMALKEALHFCKPQSQVSDCALQIWKISRHDHATTAPKRRKAVQLSRLFYP